MYFTHLIKLRKDITTSNFGIRDAFRNQNCGLALKSLITIVKNVFLGAMYSYLVHKIYGIVRTFSRLQPKS